MSKLKYAIIGSGTMGQEHIKNINLIDNAEVVAICDSHEKSIDLSKKLLKNKVNIFDSHIELIEAEIADAYIVATPNFTHIEILKDLLKTKAHLLVEKPFCTSVDDCLEIKKLAKDYPSIIWTAMEYRYMPPVARLINEVAKGTIGSLKMLSIREHRFPDHHHLLSPLVPCHGGALEEHIAREADDYWAAPESSRHYGAAGVPAALVSSHDGRSRQVVGRSGHFQNPCEGPRNAADERQEPPGEHVVQIEGARGGPWRAEQSLRAPRNGERAPGEGAVGCGKAD